MARCVFQPSARADLRDVGTFIAQNNRPRVISFVLELCQTCRRLAEYLLMGRARPDLQSGLRSFPHGDYVIFYEPLADGVSIVRILHGSRDTSLLL